MKILLVNPCSETPFKETVSYPLGLLYISRVLEKLGHEVVVKNYFYKRWNASKHEIVKFLKNYSPNIFGLSCTTMNRTSCFKLAKICRKILPRTKIIMGGVHASSLYEQILENFPIDVIVVGEGEKTVAELIPALEKKKSLKRIKGIAFKDKEKIIFTGHREAIKDLDELEFPRHKLCEYAIRKNKTATMMTSRGCPYGCIFCSTSAYWGRKWRARSVKNVVDEMEYLIKTFPYIEKIFFEDDEFTIDNKRVIDICDEILKRGIKIKWECEARVDGLCEEMLIKMKRAGCTDLGLGIESGSQKILKTFKKGITPEQIKNAVRLVNKVGLGYYVFLMVGCPGETWGSVKETVRLLSKLKNLDVKSVGRLQIYPNTMVYQIAKDQGIINDSYWLTDKLIPLYTHEHSADELSKMAYYIVAKNQLQRGLINFAIFSLRFFFQKPKRAIRFVLKRLGVSLGRDVYGSG